MKINFDIKYLKMYWIGIIFLFSTFLSAQRATLIIEQINQKVFVHTTFNTFNGKQYAANGMYLVTKKGIVLFDTPWDKSQYQPLLDSIQQKHHLPVIAVFASHSHEDRAGGFEYYNQIGIPTYATKETNEILKANDQAIAKNEIELGKTYKIGGEKFIIEYFGKGHTADNTVVWLPKYKILNGGCLVKSTEATDLGFIGEADVKAWPNTIQKLMHQHPTIKLVIAGHDNWKNQGHLEHTLQLLKKN